MYYIFLFKNVWYNISLSKNAVRHESIYILPIKTTKIVNIAVISQIFWIIISRKNLIKETIKSE